jgi:hypothetical protein
MKEVSSSNFGLLIAFLLPGFVALFGVSFFSETVRTWLTVASADAPTVGGFLYVTLASLAAGLTVSTVRWAIIDTVHHCTGVRQPNWDFSRLQDNIAAYQVLNEFHYKFYQFYGNMLISLVFVYATMRMSLGVWASPLGRFDIGFLLLGVVFFAGSRDALRKYYSRVEMLLGTETRRTDALAVRSESTTENRVLNSELPLRTLKSVPVARDQQISQINRRTIRQTKVAETLP